MEITVFKYLHQMKITLLITACAFGAVVFLSSCNQVQPKSAGTPTSTPETVVTSENTDSIIRSILKAQTTAWNRGSIDEFMEGYWENEHLTFIGSRGLLYGHENALKNYKESYSNPEEMGQLEFELIEMKPLGTTFFYTIGMWQLNRREDTLAGYYNLLWQKLPEGWRIISDHSS